MKQCGRALKMMVMLLNMVQNCIECTIFAYMTGSRCVYDNHTGNAVCLIKYDDYYMNKAILIMEKKNV